MAGHRDYNKSKGGKLGRAGIGRSTAGPSLHQKPDHLKFTAKSSYTVHDLDLLRKEISCKTLSDINKIDIMQQVVALCPEIVMSIKGKPTRSLLDSGSEVTLVNESYYKEHLEHRLLPSSGSYNNSHKLFSLRGIEEGHVPLSKHFECDIEVGGQLVHRIGITCKEGQNSSC